MKSESSSDMDIHEETSPSRQTGSNRRRLPLLLALLVLVLLVAGSLALFLFPKSPAVKPVASPVSQPAAPRDGRQEPPAATGSTLTARGGPETVAGETPEDVPGTYSEPEQIAAIHLPAQATRGDLENLNLPPYPYSIYTGAFREREEAETTLREHLTHSLPAYTVPVNVQGSIAQSLYGVTQDGLWYRVLIGQYASRVSARDTLKILMEKPSGYQPEIMKFLYALECGRFLDQQEATQLMTRLADQGLFPYLQSYSASDGTKLHRVLLGCFFSRKAALPDKNELELKGYPCKIVQR